MPRPGPRPYECVRRAWHSDRHHPIRGSLIQEIFRIANEIHTPSTKMKKEWQEKLPIVVLKVEEILYSKANSEADYMDLTTLWGRVHDAIDTIIRRDKSSEDSSEFLQPCIEAALQLGCVPRRNSRSQRNNHPRGYLTGNPDFGNVAEGSSRQTSSLAPHYSNFRGKQPQCLVPPIKNCLKQNGLPPSYPPKSHAVYPLHYGPCPQPMKPQLKLADHPMEPQLKLFDGHTTKAMEPQLKLADHPVSNPSCNDHSEKEMFRKFPGCSEESTMNRVDQPKVPSDPPTEECDLSLRLGFSSMQDNDNTRSSVMNIAVSKQIVKEKNLLFDESKASLSNENLGLDLVPRKRKAVDQMNDPRLSWEPMFFPTYSKEGTSTAG